MDDSAESFTDSEELYGQRVNRYSGPAATYLSFIDEERSLYLSLVKLRNQNLSAHLYNAHCLKGRQRDSSLAQNGQLQVKKVRL